MTSRTLQLTTPNDLEIAITRDFDAPRALVWEAMTTPALLRRWLFGPPGWTMEVCEDDLRPGGEYRWVWRTPDGATMTIRGVNQEVVPFERGVRTEIMEMGCDVLGESVGTMALDERGGRTTLTLTVRYASKDVRDAMLASGMDQGMAVGYEQLDALLLTLAS